MSLENKENVMAMGFLYKYAKLDTTTIANLVNEVIYFNQVEHFNDPNDSEFRIMTGGEAVKADTIIEDLQTVCKFMGRKYINEAKPGETSLAFVQISRLLEEALKKYIGVSCFSGHKICLVCGSPCLSPLMLSHYADSHAGIVVEYEYSDPRYIKKVEYQESSKHYNYAEIMKGFDPKYEPIKSLQINDDIIKPLLFKFKQWDDQGEQRIFSEPGVAKPCSDFGLKVRRIFFGVRVMKDISDSIEKILSGKNIEFSFLRLPISHDEKQSVLIYQTWAYAKQLNYCKECKY